MNGLTLRPHLFRLCLEILAGKVEYIMNNRAKLYYNKVLGAFSPDIMSVFVNSTYNDVELENDSGSYKKNQIVYFHELFHHWQSIFTPFGQMQSFQYKYTSDEIIDLWTKAVGRDIKNRKIPIGNMILNSDAECITIALLLQASKLNLNLLDLMLYDFWNEDLNDYYEGAKIYLNPIIQYNGQEYKVKGIDIIETYDKFQESIYGTLYGLDFFDTMNPEKIPANYYCIYFYYLDEIGDDIEFPAVCEIALMSSQVGDLRDEDDWKNNHPAWRFLKIVEYMKKNKDIPRIIPDKIDSTYQKFVDYIIENCDFKKISDIQKGMRINDEMPWPSVLGIELNIAFEFKNRYPWILSYPFYYSEEAVKSLYIFEPHYLSYLDTSFMIADKDKKIYGSIGSNMLKWSSELSNKLHRQALAYQIIGQKSKRYIYKDSLQCGCGYFGIKNCPFYPKQCNGYLEEDSEYRFNLNKKDIESLKKQLECRIELRNRLELSQYEQEIKLKSEVNINNICQLDFIFNMIYNFGINDIEVDMDKDVSMKTIKEILDKKLSIERRL